MDVEPRMDRALWRIAVVTMIGTFVSLLDTTIVNVALHTLEHDFNARISQLQWIVSGYALAMATVMPLSGWAARRFGTRAVYASSLAVFTIGSALCGAAWSPASLTVFRIVQAVGGAMLMPIGMMIMAHAAGPQRLARAMSVTSVPVMLAPVLGPVVGGLLVDTLGWRWIFFVNLPLGVLGFALALRRLPVMERESREPLDVTGLVMLALGLPALTYALARIGEGSPVTEPITLISVIAGPVLIGAFVVHALRRTRPLLDVRLFRNSIYRRATTSTLVLSGTVFGSLIVLPLYLQQARGLSALATGLLLVPQGIMAAIAPLSTARLVDRFGPGRIAFAGIVIAVIGSLPLAFVGQGTSFILLAAFLGIRGFGHGMATVPLFASAFRTLRPEQVADGSTLIQLVLRAAGSIGTAIVAVVLAGALAAAGTAEVSGAYASTFRWVVTGVALALVPTALLIRAEDRTRSRPVAHVVERPLQEAA